MWTSANLDDVVLARWREWIAHKCAALHFEIAEWTGIRDQMEVDLRAKKYKHESEGKVKHRIGLATDHLIILHQDQKFWARKLLDAHAELEKRGYPSSEWIDLSIKRGIDG